jgi:hypothetical protein
VSTVDFIIRILSASFPTSVRDVGTGVQACRVVDPDLDAGGDIPVVLFDAAARHVASRIPRAIKMTPTITAPSTRSPNVTAEITMPRLGVAKSAIDIVLAGK